MSIRAISLIIAKSYIYICIFRHVERTFTFFDAIRFRKLCPYAAFPLFARWCETCFMPSNDRLTRYRALLFDAVAYGIENRIVDEICRRATGRINGRQPVLLNDVNPTSFLAIRNTNGSVLRSDPSRFSLRL